MLSISASTSSQITHLTRSDGAGSGESPAASATGLQAACGTPEPPSPCPPVRQAVQEDSPPPLHGIPHTGRPPASLKPGSERIPLSERHYSSKHPVKRRSGISPTGSPDGLPEARAKPIPPHQRYHPLTVPRHTSDSASRVIVPAPLRPAKYRKCIASTPSLSPAPHSLTAFPRLPSGSARSDTVPKSVSEIE